MRKRISDLEDGQDIERFGMQTFMASDSDMRFYTGLPDCFLNVYNFAKPRPGFSLNYYCGYTNAAEHASYVVLRERPRNMSLIDELLLPLTRLRLSLLERDLVERHNITLPEVSHYFCYLDRPSMLLSWTAEFFN